MIADVPTIIVDAGIIAGVFVSFSAALALLWKTAPVRWLRKHLSSSFGEWMRDQVQEANAEHYDYVRYHLGPNGTTKPIHQRLCDVERAVKQPRLPAVDWNGPYDDLEQHQEES